MSGIIEIDNLLDFIKILPKTGWYACSQAIGLAERGSDMGMEVHNHDFAMLVFDWRGKDIDYYDYANRKVYRYTANNIHDLAECFVEFYQIEDTGHDEDYYYY